MTEKEFLKQGFIKLLMDNFFGTNFCQNTKHYSNDEYMVSQIFSNRNDSQTSPSFSFSKTNISKKSP